MSFLLHCFRAVICVFGLLCWQAVSHADASRPNILYFYVDDMGWGSIGPNGQADRRARGLPSVQTPNLDRLAAEGLNFRRGYGCHVCSPARSSQQTGFHQGHTFADRNDPNNAKKAIRADDLSMGDALSAAGYATGYWGKWGYGGSKDLRDPQIENVQTLPTSHGYQHVLAELHHVRAHTFFQPTLWKAPTANRSLGGLELVPNSLTRYQGARNYPGTPALQNHPAYPQTAYCDDAYSFAALDFVRRQGQIYNDSGQPFFGLLAVQIPHAPFAEITRLPDWDQAYADDPHFASLSDQSRQWAAMVTRIDAHFGNILNALEDPNQDGDRSDSVANNTLVIFQSDNGGPKGKNLIEFDANGGLRGSKGSIHEGGIRVPLLMRWPAMIHHASPLKAGTDTDMAVDVTDLLPTFCELAGVAAPLGIDGVSIAPTLTGIGKQRQREFLIHEAGNGQSILCGDHKLVRTNKGVQLYDLQNDHAEEHDVAAMHPQQVQRLTELLLGERVTEPRGFANTYHQWIGPNHANTSNPEHWSDYRYANAGVTYMTDSGAPQVSWVAQIRNQTKNQNIAVADGDLQFLALEIRGNENQDASQSLILGPNINLTGRNEIRIGPLGRLEVNRGTVSSLRWIEIDHRGQLDGNGILRGEVYNRGTLVLPNSADRKLQIDSNYYQDASGVLSVTLGQQGVSPLSVANVAELSGKLDVTLEAGFRPQTQTEYAILKASTVTGRFQFPPNNTTLADGTRLTVRYTDRGVFLALHPSSSIPMSKPRKAPL